MSAINKDIIAITRSVYGIALQDAKLIGAIHEIVANTTLNEKFNIQSGVLPSAAQVPNLGYLVIGNQGHVGVVGADGSLETDPVPHHSTDAALYNHIAFAIRPIDNDFDAVTRKRYCLRRVETISSVQYYVYYGLRLSLSGVSIQLQNVTVDETTGATTVTPFVPTTDNLNPTKPSISNTGTALGTSSSVAAAAIVTINFSTDVINEILSAHTIRTGSTRSPVLSEIGLCSGVDKDVQGQAGSAGAITYSEVIACQVNLFISTYHPVGYSADGMDITLDIGGAEPLLGTNTTGTQWLP